MVMAFPEWPPSPMGPGSVLHEALTLKDKMQRSWERLFQTLLAVELLSTFPSACYKPKSKRGRPFLSEAFLA